MCDVNCAANSIHIPTDVNCAANSIHIPIDVKIEHTFCRRGNDRTVAKSQALM